MNFGLGGVYFMHISEGKGWKQRPDEEGIATCKTSLPLRPIRLPFSVGNRDLMNKGLRLYFRFVSLLDHYLLSLETET